MYQTYSKIHENNQLPTPMLCHCFLLAIRGLLYFYISHNLFFVIAKKYQHFLVKNLQQTLQDTCPTESQDQHFIHLVDFWAHAVLIVRGVYGTFNNALRYFIKKAMENPCIAFHFKWTDLYVQLGRILKFEYFNVVINTFQYTKTMFQQFRSALILY